MTYRIFRGILQGLIWAGLILILLLLVLYFSQGSGFREGRSDQDAIKVLLMGNSYTFQNDLPGLLEELAASGGHSLSASMLARGGWTLQQHRFSPETGQKLADQAWDVVILQE